MPYDDRDAERGLRSRRARADLRLRDAHRRTPEAALSLDAPLLGAWRQVRPDTSPAQILVLFEAAGVMTYIVAMNGEQRVPLRWSIDGDSLVTVDAQGRRSASPFRFASPTMLVLDREDGRYVYRRDG